MSKVKVSVLTFYFLVLEAGLYNNYLRGLTDWELSLSVAFSSLSFSVENTRKNYFSIIKHNACKSSSACCLGPCCPWKTDVCFKQVRENSHKVVLNPSFVFFFFLRGQ